jgi:hypothetical protein
VNINRSVEDTKYGRRREGAVLIPVTGTKQELFGMSSMLVVVVVLLQYSVVIPSSPSHYPVD